MDTKLTQQQLTLLGVWRQAFRAGGRFELALPSKSDAVRMRFALYNAIRPIRLGTLVDEELAQACQDLSVRVEGSMVFLEEKSTSAIMQAAMAALGGQLPEGAAPKQALEIAADESLKKLMGIMESTDQPDTVGRVTPYYTREGGK